MLRAIFPSTSRVCGGPQHQLSNTEHTLQGSQKEGEGEGLKEEKGTGAEKKGEPESGIG